MFLKVLGLIDFVSLPAFLMLILEVESFGVYIFVVGLVLVLKGLFTIKNWLSFMSMGDIVAGSALLISPFGSPPVFLLWFGLLFLFVKGWLSLM